MNSETYSHTTGFLSSREIVLTNTSDIPMTYHLRVSSDEAEVPTEGEQVEEGTEFDVEPKRGVLPANYHQSIRVHVSLILSLPLVLTCTLCHTDQLNSGGCEGIFEGTGPLCGRGWSREIFPAHLSQGRGPGHHTGDSVPRLWPLLPPVSLHPHCRTHQSLATSCEVPDGTTTG